MDCSPPDSSVHGILQARILTRVAVTFYKGSSRPRDGTWVSSIVGRFFTIEPVGDGGYPIMYSTVLFHLPKWFCNVWGPWAGTHKRKKGETKDAEERRRWGGPEKVGRSEERYSPLTEGKVLSPRRSVQFGWAVSFPKQPFILVPHQCTLPPTTWLSFREGHSLPFQINSSKDKDPNILPWPGRVQFAASISNFSLHHLTLNSGHSGFLSPS